MISFKSPAVAITLLIVLAWSPVAVLGQRLLNITHLDNCEDFGLTAPLHVATVNYIQNASTGLVDAVTGTYRIKEVDTSNKLLRMTIYQCTDSNYTVPCKDWPQTHEILLDCDRFKNDKTGPWHAVSQAMTLGVCGETPGYHTFNYDSLATSHLTDYVNLSNPYITRVGIRHHFINPDTNNTWACKLISVTLV